MTAALLSILGIAILFSGCKEISGYKSVDRPPAINPDYSGIVLPPNIAALNFYIEEQDKKFSVKVYSEEGRPIYMKGKQNLIKIPKKKWQRLLEKNKGRSLFIEISGKNQSDGWVKYSEIKNEISEEELDGYLVYRKIHPGYNLWDEMGLFQRDLQSYNEKPLMVNRASDNNCMNCHAFAMNDANTMMFHMRAKHGGTMIIKDGEINKVNTKTAETLSAGVYPAWHPNGNLIAFSVNEIHQYFHAQPDKKIEVMDHASDLVLYDLESNSVSIIEQASGTEAFETFPSWSPDGKYLYYCSSDAHPPAEYENIKYSLLRIKFDEKEKYFGKVDTVVSAGKTGMSVSFPRISPDGNYVLFCMSDYGNFSIWHDESDLYIYDLVSGNLQKPAALNSHETESYHTWSSNGSWIVFSSRRMNGLFTRPYFAYHYGDGSFAKPFLLPQKDPAFYEGMLQSYNVPELIKTRVSIPTWKLRHAAMQEADQSKFEE